MVIASASAGGSSCWCSYRRRVLFLVRHALRACAQVDDAGIPFGPETKKLASTGGIALILSYQAVRALLRPKLEAAARKRKAAAAAQRDSGGGDGQGAAVAEGGTDALAKDDGDAA
mmetsp:Transcript_8601/g.18841  ORF Transcript_8601/g.18841 Transcript_8601/m.18841 type:complete len:116 (-) Transcript_8601:338-685(-)